MARVLVVLAVLSPALLADEIAEARADLSAADPARCRAALDRLVAIDSGDAVRAVVEEAERLLKRLKRDTDAHTKAVIELVELKPRIVELALRESRLAGKEETAAGKALKRDIERIKKECDRKNAQLDLAWRNVVDSEVVVSTVFDALCRFRSEDAVAAIEAAATGRGSADLQRACVEALRRIGSPRSVPVLRAVAAGKDPQRRAIAARALVPADPADIAPQLADKVWEVRYGAYEAAARGAPKVAIPILVQARATAHANDAPRIDRYLHRLTGRTFDRASEWTAWWEKEGEAVGAGTFTRGSDPPPTGPLCLGVACESRRIRIVLSYHGPTEIELDENMERVRPAGLASLKEVADAAKEAVAALPNDAEFNLVAAEREAPFSPSSVRATGLTKTKAAGWLDDVGRGWASELPIATLMGILEEHQPSRFGGLPDTILFICASPVNADPDDTDRFLCLLDDWNLAAGVVIHCVGIGEMCDVDTLAMVALQTGGSFIAGGRRFPAKLPAPGADRGHVGRARVHAYRAIRSSSDAARQEALVKLADIGEDAYPLLPLLVECLAAGPDETRTAALTALGAMGPWAQEAIPAIRDLTDGSSGVSDAAKLALSRISGG